ncbi:MAG: hypothetical protein AAF604_19315 [Acidobacteriota bacterium]
MKLERRIFWIVVAVVTLGVGILLFGPRVKESLAPELVAAWVAVEPPGTAMATVGRTEFPAGESFRLHAVLEARRRGGERLFYTTAPALTIDGEVVPAEAMRRWDRAPHVRVLWFTVEGVVPFLRLQPDQSLDRFRFASFFRPDWGFAWSQPGRLTPAHDARLARDDRRLRRPFGTQRYQVHIELRELPDDEVPTQRLVSWGAEDVMPQGDAFPSAVVGLSGPAAAASRVFGLTQIESEPGVPEAVRSELAGRAGAGLLFTRVHLLAEILRQVGRAAEELDWQRVDLASGPPWGPAGVAPGDLLRVGDRFVVLYEDEGTVGQLDRSDLCFDYAQGASVRNLGDVFAELGGDVEWASLRLDPAS